MSVRELIAAAILPIILAQPVVAAPVNCRSDDSPALLKVIEARKDAVLFNYFPSELEAEFSLEYLNCRTGAAISVQPDAKLTDYRGSQSARNIIKTAIESPVTYTRAQVIDALRKANFNAVPGKLDGSVCACEPDILKKAARKWD